MDVAQQESANLYLNENEWAALQENTLQQLKPIVSAHRQRRITGVKHPIIDFLFEYYHFKASKLLEWTPGIGVYLLGKQANKLASRRGFHQSDTGVFVDPQYFPVGRIVGLDWTINLLEQTLNRKPQFNCFGLHEWCMIYEKQDIRHPALRLRLSHNQTRDVVEQHSVQCTHYDAYRFYSDTAIKFNRTKLCRETIPDHEQPGCLHANMDLYRWAYKFHPWISSDLIGKTFLLAIKIRETDMRASPYNVEKYCDLPAIEIETPAGKLEYVTLQKAYFETAQILRLQLSEKLKGLRAHL